MCVHNERHDEWMRPAFLELMHLFVCHYLWSKWYYLHVRAVDKLNLDFLALSSLSPADFCADTS